MGVGPLPNMAVNFMPTINGMEYLQVVDTHRIHETGIFTVPTWMVDFLW